MAMRGLFMRETKISEELSYKLEITMMQERILEMLNWKTS